jgi:phosphoenolpyruvate synthase/pyruvate phosphate dikinase
VESTRLKQVDVLACLSDEQIHASATVESRAEALYDSLQDIERAIDPSGETFLLQAANHNLASPRWRFGNL